MEYRERANRASSGAEIYLIPNKHGTGKTAIRRPHPPPTSPPLDDDFDATTQDGTTTRGPRSAWETGPGFNMAEAPANRQPMSPNLAGGNNRWLVGSETKARARLRVRERPRRPRSSDTSSYGDISLYGKRTVQDTRYGDGNEGDTEQGYNQKQEITVSTIRPDDIGDMPISRSRTGRKTVGSRRRRGGDNEISHTNKPTDGPAKGQDYRLIDRRVVEDGPERTVTISTWREDVARRASDEMSVYYVNPDDYLEGDREVLEKATASGNRPDQAKRPVHTEGRQDGWSADSSNQSAEEDIRNRQAYRMFKERDIRPLDSASNPPMDRAKSPTNTSTHGIRSPKVKNPSVIYSSAPLRRRNDQANTSLLSSIPERTPPNCSGRCPPRTSTPTKGLPPLPSFHPTDSSSSLASLDDRSTASFDLALASCFPSLLHIKPALLRLGIRTEEHLRAVGRLSEDTRDREVKEEALRNGVTVVEWAILLDKLQSL